MIGRLGIIGVGHLAGFLVEGLHRVNSNVEIILSPRNTERSASLAGRFDATVAADNQSVVDATDLILLTTRPGDAVAACESVSFRAGQLVISTAANLPLAALIPATAPAEVVRAMPISCAALNESPTMLYPEQPKAREFFGLLGNVHVLPDEAQFTPATVIAAFYGWVYALLDVTVDWTIGEGVPPKIARELVVETMRGAADMALAQPDTALTSMLDSLATPGGITEYGLNILNQKHGLDGWTAALDGLLARMTSTQ